MKAIRPPMSEDLESLKSWSQRVTKLKIEGADGADIEPFERYFNSTKSLFMGSSTNEFLSVAVVVFMSTWNGFTSDVTKHDWKLEWIQTFLLIKEKHSNFNISFGTSDSQNNIYVTAIYILSNEPSLKHKEELSLKLVIFNKCEFVLLSQII